MVTDNSIIAVHVGGEIGQDINVGRLIDKILIKNIIEWGKQLNSAPFNLKEESKCVHNK